MKVAEPDGLITPDSPIPLRRDPIEQAFISPDEPIPEERVREVRSCWYDLERYDALVKRNQIETAWLALKPPELDHVEFR